MIGAMIVISVAAILAVIIGTAVGAGNNNGFGQGVWPSIFVLPLIALPIGLILMITLLVISIVQRRKQNHDEQG
jgi:TRAP-type C4-dicarboxylate transport system permease small subunit